MPNTPRRPIDLQTLRDLLLTIGCNGTATFFIDPLEKFILSSGGFQLLLSFFFFLPAPGFEPRCLYMWNVQDHAAPFQVDIQVWE